MKLLKGKIMTISSINTLPRWNNNGIHILKLPNNYLQKLPYIAI